MKWQSRFSLIFFVLLMPIFGWLCYINTMTRARNRACLPSTLENLRGTSSPISSELQEVINEHSHQNRDVGLQVTVIFPDQTSWNGVAGYADRSDHCPITLQHHLYIGSMTKLFTATLVMEQVENGSLSLQDTLHSLIPLFPENYITVRYLLTHTSGLPDYARNPWFQFRWFGLPDKIWRPVELARVIHDKPLQFTPGSQHEYSNSNYLLLGMILEKVTGQRYLVLLDENIRLRLSLNNTYFLSYPENIAIANGYDVSLLPLGHKNVTGFRRSLESGAYAAGGILSTSQDVARFVHALFNCQVVSNASLVEMTTFINAQDEDMPEQIGYGLGIRHLLIDGVELVGHTGSIPGYSGIVIHQVEKNYTVAILSNLSTIDQISLLAEIQKTVLKYQSH